MLVYAHLRLSTKQLSSHVELKALCAAAGAPKVLNVDKFVVLSTREPKLAQN